MDEHQNPARSTAERIVRSTKEDRSLELTALSTGLVVVALLAISTGALIKGMTGLGLPLIAVPAIAAYTSVEEAVVLMIIPTFGSTLWLVGNHRRFAKLLSGHLPFLGAGFIGGIFGTFALAAVDDRWLKLTLAAWLAIYLLQFAFGALTDRKHLGVRMSLINGYEFGSESETDDSDVD